VLSPAVVFWLAVLAIVFVFFVALYLLNQDAAEQGSSVPGTQDECAASGNVVTAVTTCPDTPQVEEPAPEPTPPIQCCPVWWEYDDDDRPEEGQIIYRVYGGDDWPLGRSWTPVNPRHVQDNQLLQAQWGRYAFRAVAGLPDTNEGTHI
jgi:hypothetical protein